MTLKSTSGAAVEQLPERQGLWKSAVLGCCGHRLKSANPAYKYSPITGQQIRLIRLLPEGNARKPLRGELITATTAELPPPLPPNSPGFSKPVDVEKYICYEAISYVWGQAGFEEELLTSEGSIAITPSLASILRRVRNKRTPRLLWADAVCINQQDASEKEVQVSLMGTIYASAVRVICDLGEGSEGVHAILDAMSLYWRRSIRNGMVMAEQSAIVLEAEHIAPVLGLTLPTEEEAAGIKEIEEGTFADEFAELTSLPWFQRFWVIQEFVLGREVVMLFGTRQVSWGELYAGMMLYRDVPWPWRKPGTNLDDVLVNNTGLSYLVMCMIHAARTVNLDTPHGKAYSAVARQLAGTKALSEAFSLPMCLMAFCFSKVTLPRDRYFAVLGLLHDANIAREPSLRPDYASPIEEITRRYWRWGLQQVSGADLLQTAGLAGSTGTYPTWIRDITADSWLGHVWALGPGAEASHRAGGGSDSDWRAYFDDDDPDRLCLRAYHLDDVSATMATVGSEFDFVEIIRRVEDTMTFFTRGVGTVDSANDLRYAHTGEGINEAALKTLCNYSIRDELPAFKQSSAACLRKGLLLPLLYLNADIVEKPARSILRRYIRDELPQRELFTRVCTTWRLRMVKTRKGFFGCMPSGAREGDSIWIVPGSRLPFIFRPSETHPGSYQVVGRGYVHGVMNGEALLMPGFSWRIVSLR